MKRGDNIEKQFTIQPCTICSNNLPLPLFIVDVFTDSYQERNEDGVIAIHYKGDVSNDIFKNMDKETFMAECEKMYEKIINSKDGKMEVFIEENYIAKEK